MRVFRVCLKRQQLVNILGLCGIVIGIVSLVSRGLPCYCSKERQGSETVLAMSGIEQFVNEEELVGDMNSTVHLYPYGSIEENCNEITYETSRPLPKTSVVLTFHNSESLDKLLRTIRSILKRTPKELLEEIVLIADHSTTDDLTTGLDQKIAAIDNSIIKLKRSQEPLGAIKARLWGIRVALGPIVVCLDSHMEVHERWLHPLVYEILLNEKTLASPHLDWMTFDEKEKRWTIEYGGDPWVTFFSWNLAFGWQDMSKSQSKERGPDVTLAFNSPITIGVFAIAKKWFMEIGEFDGGMQGWGPENIELSLRVWLFGGRVVNVPCSRIIHDETPGARDYRASWTNIMQRNAKRVIEVWFDEYKRYFYYYNPKIALIDAGDLSARFEVKKGAVHNFKWFLDNIFPQLGMYDVNSLAYNGAKNLAYPEQCFNGGHPGDYNLYRCNEQSVDDQAVYWNMEGDLRSPLYRANTIYSETRNQYKVIGTGVIGTDHSEQNAIWFHWKDGPLIEVKTNLCLEAATDSELSLFKCEFTKQSQQWRFRTYTKEYLDLYEGNASTGHKSPHLFVLSLIFKASQVENWTEVERLVENYKMYVESKVHQD